MFAQRTEWGGGSPPLALAVEHARRAGRPLLDLTETNPTRCGFRYPDAGFESALADPRARLYTPDAAGMRSAREAVAAAYAPTGSCPDPGRIVLTAGTSEAYSHLFRLLLNPGDALLVPGPSYPLLDMLARLHDIRLVVYPLHYDGRWWLDVEALRAAAQNSRARAIVVISPNNPTGSCLSSAEQDAVESLAADLGLAVIADEVFADFRLSPADPAPPSFAARQHALTFTLNGISKMLGLPQMKLAWTVISGPAAAAAEAARRLDVINDTFLSVATPVQLALPAWLARRTAIQTEILQRIRENHAALERCATVRALHLEAGWCAVLRVPRTQDDEALALTLLEHDGVLVDPGGWFGFPAGGHLVVSLLPPPAVFRDGLHRLDARVSLGAP